MRQRESLRDRLTKTPERLRHWQQEDTILKITELMCKHMKIKGITRKELAAKLETSPSHITHLLNGTHNMTVRTISDIFTVMGLQLEPEVSTIQKGPTFDVGESSVNYQAFSTDQLVLHFQGTAEITIPTGSEARPIPVVSEINA